MNPIEHVWDTLGRRVAGRQPPPQTLQELERVLLEEWDRIPQLVINSLIDSCLKGLPTKTPRPERSCPYAFTPFLASASQKIAGPERVKDRNREIVYTFVYIFVNTCRELGKPIRIDGGLDSSKYANGFFTVTSPFPWVHIE
ncbi:transposable element Tcb2 transposase [Trichonephila clavipes]|nr:transposable element Tcb2 transposase [Trichonephila clavipes]